MTIKRHMRAKKSGQTPKNPEKLDDIPIPFPEAYRTNLMYDKKSTRSRILVFFLRGRIGPSGVGDNVVHGRNFLHR
ncbi:hypothetical protein DPMN_157147 [Dreissena polymorpha]|uniref:Uncharacterized protein n=1 Tax=Dreissena polymorpha TaxID=45954 RepID=A0A9D4IM01_DREPO|nr:hypothetical protein DPMN_157147 [Dreissena polymorpha]